MYAISQKNIYNSFHEQQREHIKSENDNDDIKKIKTNRNFTNRRERKRKRKYIYIQSGSNPQGRKGRRGVKKINKLGVKEK